jgi:predicted Fe-S protein YdhL (DUF1289 family)
MDDTRGHCIGCGRTLAEIGSWLGMTDAERRQTNARAKERLQAAASDHSPR